MNESIVRRLAALEQAGNYTSTLRVVFADAGETAKEALLREGVDPDSGQLVLVVTFA